LTSINFIFQQTAQAKQSEIDQHKVAWWIDFEIFENETQK